MRFLCIYSPTTFTPSQFDVLKTPVGEEYLPKLEQDWNKNYCHQVPLNQLWQTLFSTSCDLRSYYRDLTVTVLPFLPLTVAHAIGKFKYKLGVAEHFNLM